MSGLVRLLVPLVALGALSMNTGAEARNDPCSGTKGGVSHCRNGKFVFSDGSTSASKKVCSRG